MSELPLSRSRQAASHVAPLVQAVTEDPATDYRALCRRVGSLLRQSGLAGLLAQLTAQKERRPAHGLLLKHLREGWLALHLAATDELTDVTKLLPLALGAKHARYIELTRGTLLLLRWHKRLAEALIPPPDKNASRLPRKGNGSKTESPARRRQLLRGGEFSPGDNPGLALAKYIPAFGAPAEKRSAWLQQLTVLPSACCRAYQVAFTRYRTAVRQWVRAGEAVTFELTSASRLLVGLGQKSVLEFGLGLHPLYGVPCIPGSSLKGVAAAYAAQAGGGAWGRGVAGASARELFGRTDLSGLVDFLDAWWIPGPKPPKESAPFRLFELEIVNPHYSAYLADGSRPPDGMESPVPFTFLAVRARTRFLFTLKGGDADSRTRAQSILTGALTTRGVGAKTALGYGRFEDPSIAPPAAAP